MSEKQKILEKLRALKPEIKEGYKVRSIALFGSWVRGEQSETSDIDLLVEFEDQADLIDWMGLEEFLEEHLGRRVDLVPKRALRPEFRDQVFREAAKV